MLDYIYTVAVNPTNTLGQNIMAEHKTFDTGAQKDIAGKPRFDLIPPEALNALAQTYALGAAKYSDRNWEKGIPFSVCLGALKRHLNEFELGEMMNKADNGYEHMTHVMWWAVAVVTFLRRGQVELNDLPAYKNEYKNYDMELLDQLQKAGMRNIPE